MMYHPFKFGCKKTSSSVVMVETVIFNYMSPHCDHELEDSKPIFLHDTGPWWCIAIPNLVTDSSAVEDILSKWTFTGILNLSCDLGLDHNRAIQSFHKTIQLMLMYHQTKFSCKKINSSENILKSNIFMTSFLTVILTLKSANQSFWKIIRLVMMHHYTKFGSKRFCNSENITRANIHWHFAVSLTFNRIIIIITYIYNVLNDALSASRIHNKLKTILSKYIQIQNRQY